MWVDGCVTAPVAWTSGPGALTSRGPWGLRCRGTRGSRPVARAAVGMQECAQIGENGLSTQPLLACRTRLSVTSRWRRWCRMRFSVRWLVQNALFREVAGADCAFP